MRPRNSVQVGIVLLMGTALIAGGVFLASRHRQAGATPASIKREPAPESASLQSTAESHSSADADGTIDKVVAATQSRSNVSRAIIDAEVAFKLESEKRQKIASALAPYSEKAPALKERIVAEKGPITKEKIPALVAWAEQCEAQFWKEWDFDNADSFNAIYQARAALDLCLEADPNDEQSLRQMLEVVQAGWPSITYGEEHTQYALSDDPAKRALAERDFECLNVAGPVAWTLWKEDISKHTDVTLDDLAVALDALRGTPGSDLFTVADFEARKKRNPNATKQDIINGMAAERLRRWNEVLDWAIKACRRNPDWQVYCSDLEAAKTGLAHGDLSPAIIHVRTPTGEDTRNMRYWGRLGSFLGPEDRRSRLTCTALLWRKAKAGQK